MVRGWWFLQMFRSSAQLGVLQLLRHFIQMIMGGVGAQQ